MKSTFKSKINKVLSFLGFNVVSAKRPRAKKSCSGSREANSLRTHYVGDDCPGGHAVVGYSAELSAIGEHNTCIGPVQQPNSVNDVKGPTS